METVLSDRLHQQLDQLPLVLAGPILRRTEPTVVTVWVALQQTCWVTLTVFKTVDGGATIAAPIWQGEQATTYVGDRLHIGTIMVFSTTDLVLQPDQIYAYDLTFRSMTELTRSPQSLQQAMVSPRVPHASISYFSHQLPTFSLPPTDIHQLKLVQGSCHKLHGNGQDALAILDELIGHSATQPNARPHYLFLTGDQIYGDDVADPLLWALSRVGDTLLGWEEQLPVDAGIEPAATKVSPQSLQPGQRSQVAEVQGGFTAGLHGQPNRAKSHLFSLGEYCALYLYTWSPVLWVLLPLPTAKELGLTGKTAKHWQTELRELYQAAHTVWKLRRALANVPTYMIFDDHDISDDWNLNQAWCLRVLGKALGRRTVQNGLVAYTLFQGWGNTPRQFQAQQVGDRLLQSITAWSQSQGTDLAAWSAIAQDLGLPAQTPVTGLPQLRVDGDTLILDRAIDALTWHYTVQGPQHTIIVLDTRTWRGYPLQAKTTAPPKLLSPSAFHHQLQRYLEQAKPEAAIADEKGLTLIVAPTNLFSLQLIDQIQHWNLHQNEVYKNDVGDAWNIHRQALANFLRTVFTHRHRVVVLSGDIHYGSVVHVEFWSHTASNSLPIADASQGADAPSQSQVLVQLTASAFKNSETKTRLVHTKLKSLLPERIRTWIGWNHPLELQETTPRFWLRWFGPAATPGQLRSDEPDWHYQIQWILRQPAQTPFWGRDVQWLPKPPRPSSWRSRLSRWMLFLWRNRWLQEGREVVGRNNLGVVHFEEFQRTNHTIILQDLYWYAPWEANRVVFSRYAASLESKQSLAQKAQASPAIQPVSTQTHFPTP